MLHLISGRHGLRLGDGSPVRQFGIDERCGLCPYARIILDFDVRLGEGPGEPWKLVAIDGMVFISHVEVADDIRYVPDPLREFLGAHEAGRRTDKN